MDLFCFSEFSDRLPVERGVGGLLKGDGWECKPNWFFRFVKFNAIDFFTVILSNNGAYTYSLMYRYLRGLKFIY